MRAVAALSLFATAGLLASCQVFDVLEGPSTDERPLPSDSAPDSGTLSDEDSASSTTPPTDSEPSTDTAAQACQPSEVFVTFATWGQDSGSFTFCPGDLAQLVFRYALCSCTDITALGGLASDSYRSSKGLSYIKTGAPVGANRDITAPGAVDVGGTMVLTGPSGLRLPGVGTFGGDLKIQGQFQFAGALTVARDLWVGGMFYNYGAALIGRDLHQGGGIALAGLTTPAGKTIKGSFQLERPCACAPEQTLDIASAVEDGAANNRNSPIGLDPNALSEEPGDAALSLPCGRLYLSSVNVKGNLTIRVSGRVVLFIDGPFSVGGTLTLDLGDDGELDLWIRGAFAGATAYAGIDKPARLRLYVASNATIGLASESGFAGNLYAPHAEVAIAGPSEWSGSVFANRLSLSGEVRVHYDRDVLGQGASCEDSSPDPQEACGGYGAMCLVEADCCAPLVCDASSSCGPLIVL